MLVEHVCVCLLLRYEEVYSFATTIFLYLNFPNDIHKDLRSNWHGSVFVVLVEHVCVCLLQYGGAVAIVYGSIANITSSAFYSNSATV